MGKEETHIAIFGGDSIRKKFVDNKWYFSVVDVVNVLTGSPTPRQYWGKIKDREFLALQLSPIWVQLKMKSSDGKEYMTDCANTQSIFRIIQSIPSKKAEPLKRWLSKVGYERVQEISNYYKRKTYKNQFPKNNINLIIDFMHPGDLSRFPDDLFISGGDF